jgi:glutathione synthase/RimK-type ligase-like ATP-grasp enzyme
MNGIPQHIAALTRDRVAEMFADEASIVAPATKRADRDCLHHLAQGQIGLSALLRNENFPIIVRPYGSHAGEGLEKIDSPAEVRAYLEKRSEQQFYLAPFVDYAGPDGFFRKQRIAVIDGRPFPSHWAVSNHWMVHYLNSGMQENEAWRAEEASWMRDFDIDFAIRHAPAFNALTRKIGLDYFVIDCAEMPDGRLLLFEAQVAMIVHAMDATGIFSYKGPAMQKLFSAFQSALERRCSHLS